MFRMQRIWPFAKGEGRLFLSMLAITTLINVNFTLLRNSKSALIVTNPGGGVGTIPFLQVLGVLPAAVGCTWLLTRLMRRYSIARVFRFVTIGFLVFFLAFAFGLYPHRHTLHLQIPILSAMADGRLRGLAALFQEWTFTMYFVLAEMWKVAILTVLFWGFINRQVLLKEAKKIYAPVMLGSSLGAILAGPINHFAMSEWARQYISLGYDEWHHSLCLLALVITLIGLMILAVFHNLACWIEGRKDEPAEEAVESRSSQSLSVSSCFGEFIRSPYLRWLGVIVFADYVAYSLGEVVFFERLHALFPASTDYCRCMGQISFWGGLLTGIFALVVTPLLVQKTRWHVAAITIPIALLVTMGAFFLSVYARNTEWFIHICAVCGMSALQVQVFLGASQFVLCRAAKYTLFDTTKELAFVPLDRSSQIKGKLLIDGIGARFGRASCAVLNIALFARFASFTAAVGPAAILALGFIVLWMWGVREVGRRFDKDSTQTPVRPITQSASANI